MSNTSQSRKVGRYGSVVEIPRCRTLPESRISRMASTSPPSSISATVGLCGWMTSTLSRPQPFKASVDVAEEVGACPGVVGAIAVELRVGAAALGRQAKLVVAVQEAPPDPLLGEHVVIRGVDEVDAAVQCLVVDLRRGLLRPVVPVRSPKGRPKPQPRDLDTRPNPVSLWAVRCS